MNLIQNNKADLYPQNIISYSHTKKVNPIQQSIDKEMYLFYITSSMPITTNAVPFFWGRYDDISRQREQLNLECNLQSFQPAETRVLGIISGSQYKHMDSESVTCIDGARQY